MAGETKLLGSNEILFLYGPIKNAGGTTVSANYFPIGCLTTNELSETVAMNDGTKTKCDLSPDKTYNGYSYQITFDAVAIEADGLKTSHDTVSEIMIDAYTNKKHIFWKIETTHADDTKTTKFGKGFLSDLSRTAPAEGEITFSGTIQGSGLISNTDLHV